MIFLRYDDVPGVIGRVGTLLGEAGVNIANMAVSRNREGGKALMVLSIDTPASPEVLASLGVGVDDAFLVGRRRRVTAASSARCGPGRKARRSVRRAPADFPLPSPQFARRRRRATRHRGLRSQRSLLAPGASFVAMRTILVAKRKEERW